MSETPPALSINESIVEETNTQRGGIIGSEPSQAIQDTAPYEKEEPNQKAEIDIVHVNTNPVGKRFENHQDISNRDGDQGDHVAYTSQCSTANHQISPNPETTTGLEISQGDNNEVTSLAAATSQEPMVNIEATRRPGAIENSQAGQVAHDAAINSQEPTNYEAVTNLEIDSDETDSAIEDMTPISSTASLRSSIYEAVQENGRTYHRYKEGKYLLPNDEVEQERLGTGIWAIEFALQHPTANIIGSDLSPIQPNFVPLNCRFEVDDAEDDWAYSHKFDFIHGRMLFTCFKDPAGVIASAFKSLEHGRYFELMDVNFPFRAVDDSLQGTALGKWCSLLIEGAKVLGKDWTCTSKYPKYFQDAGFVDVEVVKHHWPTNTWAKSEHQKMLGRWLQQDLLDGVSAMSMAALTRGLKMSPSEVELFLVDVRSDIQNRHIHAYCQIDVVFGRKPE